MTPQAQTNTRPSTPAQIEDQSIQLHREFVAILCTATGMHEQLATPIATAIVNEMRQRWGGARLGRKDIYIPSPDKSQRNAAIRAEFDGTNAAVVCKKHGIGRSRLYEIAGGKAQ